MRPRLMVPSSSSEAVTAAMTRAPEPATALRSVLRPSAAIETIVSMFVTKAIGPKAEEGSSPAERIMENSATPAMNQGSTRLRGQSPRMFAAGGPAQRRSTAGLAYVPFHER